MHGKDSHGSSEVIVLDSDEDGGPPPSVSKNNRVPNAPRIPDVIALDRGEASKQGVTAKQFRDEFNISIGSKPSEVQVFISNVPEPSRKRPHTARKSMSSFTPKFSEVIDILSDEEETEEVSKHSSEQMISLPHDAFEQFLNQIQISLKSNLEKYKNMERALTAAYEAVSITPKMSKHLHSFFLQLTLNLSLDSNKVDKYVEEVKNKLNILSFNKEGKKCVRDISPEKSVPSKKRRLALESVSSSESASPRDQSKKTISGKDSDSKLEIFANTSVPSNKERLELGCESSSKDKDPGGPSSKEQSSKTSLGDVGDSRLKISIESSAPSKNESVSSSESKGSEDQSTKTLSGVPGDSKSKIIVNKQKKAPMVLELEEEDCFVKETKSNGLKRDKATSEMMNKSRHESHLKKLKDALEKCGKEIRRLELAEIDTNDDESTYVLMYKYKNRFMKIYNKIIELEDNIPKWKSQVASLTSLGLRQIKKFKTKISRHPEINERICKVINQGIKTSLQHSYFPDFQDIMNIYEEVNKSCRLGIQREELYEEASDAFQRIGRKLQSRRKHDVCASMESYLQENESEPVLSEEFQKRLERNRTIADNSLDQIIQKFTLSAHSTISKENNEDLEEKDKEEEEEEEDIESVSSISSLSDDNQSDGGCDSSSSSSNDNDSDEEDSTDDE